MGIKGNKNKPYRFLITFRNVIKIWKQAQDSSSKMETIEWPLCATIDMIDPIALLIFFFFWAKYGVSI